MGRFAKALFLFFIVAACVDPLTITDASDSKRVLVVDGLMTDKPGPYEVRLYYSHRLGTSKLTAFEPVQGASVSIIDDEGASYALTEFASGRYRSGPELTGEIGKAYKLHIMSADREYESPLQTIKPAGQIEELDLALNQSSADGPRLDIYVDARGEVGYDNLLRWRWTTIHTTKANPEQKVRLTPGGAIPEPEPCSGYLIQNGQLVQVGECTCCICWSYNYSEGAFVSQNSFANELDFNDQFLGSIPLSAMHFYEKYYIEVDQFSLSEEVYDFWNLVEKQQKGSTDLFQPNAFRVRGNMTCTTDPDEEVLGIFSVSAVTTYTHYIDPASIPYEPGEPELVPFSCLDYFKNPTTERPPFW